MCQKIIFPNRDILYFVEQHFLCFLKIAIEPGSKSQYFGVIELNKSREFDIEAYSNRMKKEFPKKFQ